MAMIRFAPSRVLLLAAVLLALPPASQAGEPGWWTQMKRACESSGGRAASDYNTWVTQGCICNGTATGRPSCSGGSSSSGGSGQRPEQIIINELIKGILNGSTTNRAEDDARAAEQRRLSEEQAAEQKRLAEQQAAEQKRKAEQRVAVQKRQAEEQASEENRRSEEARNRLLGASKDTGLSLMNVEGSSGLQPMNASAGAASGLKPMTGQGQNSKGSRTKAYGYGRGFEHASQCFSQNSSVCTAAPADQQQTCIDDYRAGYSAGDKKRLVVMEEAFRAGERDGGKDTRNSSFADPRAEGPCRVNWIESYDRGYFQGSQARKGQ